MSFRVGGGCPELSGKSYKKKICLYHPCDDRLFLRTRWICPAHNNCFNKSYQASIVKKLLVFYDCKKGNELSTKN